MKDWEDNRISEDAKDHLTKYTTFLLKEGYCDVDVLESPTTIDQYLSTIRVMPKHKITPDEDGGL